jgi:non-heme chloroperoxidase
VQYTVEQLMAPVAGAEKMVERPDGTQIRTVAGAGEGRTVVLAHGYGGTLDGWNVLASMLAQRGYRVIAFDQRGHGGSTIGSDGIGSAQMASDYSAVLEAYDARDAVLVGHSMGGFLGMKFLLDHSDVAADRIAACLLMATFAGDVNRKNLQNRFQIPLIKSGLLLKAISNQRIGHGFARTLVGDDPQPAMFDAFLDVFRAQNHAALVPILQALTAESYYERLGEIGVPCAVTVGTKDKTTPSFHTDDIHRSIPQSTVTKLPGKGHLLNWEAPADLVGLVEGLAPA